MITITIAARRTGLSSRTVRRYLERGLIASAAGPGLTEDQLSKLRRIRRLTDLGVNLAGVEVILRMRRQIEQLQEEVAQLEVLLSHYGDVR